jgi:hypothetical protein
MQPNGVGKKKQARILIASNAQAPVSFRKKPCAKNHSVLSPDVPLFGPLARRFAGAIIEEQMT